MIIRENGNSFREKFAPTAAKQERANQNKQTDCIPVLSDRQPQDCKFFERCSAPICPLDSDWQRRSYLDGEPVCYFMLEWAKAATRPILRGAIGDQLALALADVFPTIMGGYGPLKKRLERASRTPSRLQLSEVDHG